MGAGYEICFDELFGFNGTRGDPYQCFNPVLTLSAKTNAHGAYPGYSDYGTDVCFGGLSCIARNSNCSLNESEKCIVRLSSEANAHLETCDTDRGELNYSINICCAYSTCGDGIIQPGEECDGANLDNRICKDFDNFTGGNLSCYPRGHPMACHFDTSKCQGPTGVCGNGVIEINETCDCDNAPCTPEGLNWWTCENFDGWTGGTLDCYRQGHPIQCHYNTTQCIGPANCQINETYCHYKNNKTQGWECMTNITPCFQVGWAPCNYNAICDSNEGCTCSDCSGRFWRDNCDQGLVCDNITERCQDPDQNPDLCERLFNGTQGLCDRQGEKGCWDPYVQGSGRCCGDDIPPEAWFDDYGNTCCLGEFHLNTTEPDESSCICTILDGHTQIRTREDIRKCLEHGWQYCWDITEIPPGFSQPLGSSCCGDDSLESWTYITESNLSWALPLESCVEAFWNIRTKSQEPLVYSVWSKNQT